MKSKYNVLALTLALLLSVGITGCERSEDMGEQIEDSAENAGDRIENAAEKAGDKAEDAADRAEDKVD